MATKKTATKATKKKEAAPEKGEKPTKKTEMQSAEALIATADHKAAVVQTPTEDKVMKHLKLHGKEFVGTVISDKATKTVTVEWERRVQLPKYERYERRYSRVYAHNPLTINARTGDIVRIKETRPLSKTKNFVVTEIIKQGERK